MMSVFNSENACLAVLGKPEIQNYTQKGSRLNVVFQDPLTPYTFPNGSFQSIRDIFQHDLEYKLYYWKDQSSGKVRSNSTFYIFCSCIITTQFLLRAELLQRTISWNIFSFTERCNNKKPYIWTKCWQLKELLLLYTGNHSLPQRKP